MMIKLLKWLKIANTAQFQFSRSNMTALLGKNMTSGENKYSIWFLSLSKDEGWLAKQDGVDSSKNERNVSIRSLNKALYSK
jgi:hypothetical protein